MSRELDAVSLRSFIAEIRDKLSALRGIGREAEAGIKGAGKKKGLTSLELMGLAHCLEGFYTGVEDIFLDVLTTINHATLASETWHRDLLRRMTLDIPKVRPPVIDESLARKLDEYRRFRHRARHMYSPLVPDWDRMKHLVYDLPEVLESLISRMERFLAFLEKTADRLDEG
ncbi:MAG: hypothetical protein HPY58_05850 [Firmicutes bacterium]|nr:hypothetical protein [Bacillota bacterium]